MIEKNVCLICILFWIARRAHTAKMVARLLHRSNVSIGTQYIPQYGAFICPKIDRCPRARRVDHNHDRVGYSPVAASIHAVGCFRKQRHQRLSVPGHTRFHGHSIVCALTGLGIQRGTRANTNWMRRWSYTRVLRRSRTLHELHNEMNERPRFSSFLSIATHTTIQTEHCSTTTLRSDFTDPVFPLRVTKFYSLRKPGFFPQFGNLAQMYCAHAHASSNDAWINTEEMRCIFIWIIWVELLLPWNDIA